MVQHVRVQLKLRLTLQHNVVLIQLRIHRVDLALAEGVIQSVIDGGGRDAKTRGGRPGRSPEIRPVLPFADR